MTDETKQATAQSHERPAWRDEFDAMCYHPLHSDAWCDALSWYIRGRESALAQRAAEPEQPQPDSICTEADGCPTELAVLQRYWREAQRAAEAVPKTCCGEYATCDRPCTPRGRWQANPYRSPAEPAPPPPAAGGDERAQYVEGIARWIALQVETGINSAMYEHRRELDTAKGECIRLHNKLNEARAELEQARAARSDAGDALYSAEDMRVFVAIVALLDEGFVPSAADQRWQAIRHWASRRAALSAPRAGGE